MATTYDWLKQLPASILQYDQKPLFGASPAFPWDNFTELSRETFLLPSLKIERIGQEWRSEQKLLEGLGSHPVTLRFKVAPLEGDVRWVMSQGDVETLMQLLLSKKADLFKFLDRDFVEGFYDFLAAQAVHLIQQLDWDKDLNPSLAATHELPTETSFTIDIVLGTPEKKLYGRLFFSPSFMESWRNRFADRSLSTYLRSPLAEKIQIPVQLIGGRTILTRKELATVKLGDWILLDHCSLEIDSDKGRILLAVYDRPVFRARLKQGSLKILEYPLSLEAEVPVNNEDNPDEDEDLDFGDETDFSEFEEEPVESSEKSRAPLEEKKAPEQPAEAPIHAEMAPKTHGGKTALDPNELPLTVHVEIGRLQMSVQQLLQLEPGNTLDLDIRPEDGVDLVVNGKRIAKGELLRVGEAIGVRILDIG